MNPIFLPEGWKRGSAWPIPPGTQRFPDAHTGPEVSLNWGSCTSLRTQEIRGPFFYLRSDSYSIGAPQIFFRGRHLNKLLSCPHFCCLGEWHSDFEEGMY